MDEKLKILLVDDEPIIIDTMGSYLGTEYKTLVATDGKKAYEMAKKQTPDIIVMDITMPIMDGLEAGKLLKADPETQDIPIIYSTAHGESAQVIEALRIGAADFLQKPLTKEILLSRLEKQAELLSLRRENLKKDQMIIQQSKLAAMGEMIANIAHQWRQPLMVLSTTNLAIAMRSTKGTLEDEYVQKTIDKNQKIIQSMNETIQSFSNYFQPNKVSREFDLCDSLEQSTKLLLSLLNDKEITIALPENQNILLHGFENELSQVFVNIIKNSIDAIVEHKDAVGTITVSVAQNNKDIQISISDTGGGIPDDVINRVFEPYFTTKFKSDGTGIGLYMSKMIIENSMHGTLHVENTNDGAKFTINLPKE